MSQQPIHPMSQIDAEKLRKIPANWTAPFFEKFTVPNAEIKFRIVKCKRSYKITTFFLGLILSVVKKTYQLKCKNGKKCEGLFQLDANTYKAQVKNDSDIYRGKVECIEFHTCERYQHIKRAVSYADLLRDYISLNGFKSDLLKSHIGFLFEKVETVTEIKVYVFDHECKARHYSTCSVSCAKYACHHCGVTVYKTTRDDYVCNLISPSSKASKIMNAQRFEFEKNLDIPAMNSKCKNPFYIYHRSSKYSSNIFGYGLEQLLPDLPTFIEVFGWDLLYKKTFDGYDGDDDAQSTSTVASSVSNTSIANLNDFDDDDGTATIANKQSSFHEIHSQPMDCDEIEDSFLADWLDTDIVNIQYNLYEQQMDVVEIEDDFLANWLNTDVVNN